MTKSTTQAVIRIFLIDDEPLVRAALTSLISSWDGFQITREATVDEAIEHTQSELFDVVVLSMAGCEEADSVVVKIIARKCGDSPLLVLAGDCPQQFRAQLPHLPAACVLLKTEKPSQLQNIIRNLHETSQSN